MFVWLLPFIIEGLKYLFVTVFLKYIVTKWVAIKLGEFLKFLLIRTERNVVYYIHYRDRAMKRGHMPYRPEDCADGVCRAFHGA